MPTSVGHLFLRQIVPEGIDLQGRVFDKEGITQLLREVEEKHPDRYAEVLKGLTMLGQQAAYTEGVSVNLRSLLPSKAKKRLLGLLKAKVDRIKDMNLPAEEEEQRIIKETRTFIDRVADEVLQEGVESGSPYAELVASGARGKKAQLSALVGAELLYDDHNDQTIPMLIENNYADGLDPVEYWAASYGGRKGLVDVKMATRDAGFFGKRLINAAHRQVVTDDKPVEARLPIGLPTTADDSDNVGAVLATPIAGFDAGTVITPSILRTIKRKAPKKRFLIHSPLTSRTKGGGLDRLAAGVREKRELAGIGNNIGIAAAQAVGERLSQGALGSKHSGGAAGADKDERAGFEYLDRLIEAPMTFEQAGVVSPLDGRVKAVDEAPQGGHFVTVNDQRVYIPAHRKVTVKPGQELEAGDMLSDGIPHPRDLVRYQGIGEARRRFTELFTEGLRNSGVPVHRRNAEALAAGIINHVRVTDPEGVGSYTADDIVPYSALFGSNYEPRPGARQVALKEAQGRYLEEPVLHYTPGTRLTKRVLKDLQEFGVHDVYAHDQEPGFEPEMVRGVMNLTHDPDWQTQLGGFYTGKAFVDSARRGAVSQQRGSTSFYGSLSKAKDFGKDLERKGTY